MEKQLFSNENYFIYLILILLISFIGTRYYNISPKDTTITTLYIFSHIAIIYMIIQSIRFTKEMEQEKLISENDIRTRYIIDGLMLAINVFILLYIIVYKIKQIINRTLYRNKKIFMKKRNYLSNNINNIINNLN